MVDMQNLLKENPCEIDISDYFDESKKLYSTMPVFPFLTEEIVLQQINLVVDIETLHKEVNAISTKASNEGSIISDKGYIISLVAWDECPELIKMLSIIREWAFRNEGGGVGDFDTDEFDRLPEMKQLMILNPEFDHPIEAIIGGYRYMQHTSDSYSQGPVGAHYQFSADWKKEKWIELGRSFINPYYKERDRKQSFDYVLHGLGYIYAKNPGYKGYFGKVTLYKIYELQGADRFFLACAKKYWRQDEGMWVNPEEKIEEGVLTPEQKELLEKDVFKGLFLLLRKQYMINIVPIMAVYNRMVDLDNMYYFGAFRHHSFGDTTEVGIAIAFADIYPIIKEKFADQYK